MEKLIQTVLRASNFKLIIGIILVMAVFLGLTIGVNKISKNNSYTFNLEGAEGQLEYEINRALRMSVREGLIERREFREFIEEHPIEVVFNEYFPYAGQAMLYDDRIVITFRDEDPRPNVIIHECFHVALHAAGVAPVDHHPTMEENDWCFGGCPNHPL